MKISGAVIIFAFFLSACTHPKPVEEVVPVYISPVYSELQNYSSLDSAARARIFASDSTAIKAFMKVVANGQADEEALEWWSNSMPVAVFTPDVDSLFRDLSVVESELGEVVENARLQRLHITPRYFAAVVSGRSESILFVDSVMLITLNHYLGADYPGYSHWPVYMRRNKTPERLKGDMAEAIVATAYPYLARAGEATVLSRLLYEGALAYARGRLSGEPMERALGYTADEMDYLKDNEQALWRKIVTDRILYDTSESTSTALVAPAPHTGLLGSNVPGRAGRYLGYRIVETYAGNNPGADLSFLMSPDFYNSSSTLAASGYR